MNSTDTTDTADTSKGQWEVTVASNSLSNYILVHSSSKEEVKASLSGRKRRSYAWNDPLRQGEAVPDAIAREIDKALFRYLTLRR